jgi:hypothetical protein
MRPLIGILAIVLVGCGSAVTPTPVGVVVTPPPSDSAAASPSINPLTSAFHGPYDKLPADFRSGIEVRVKALLPADFDQLSDTEQVSWLTVMEQAGSVRLDDATLTRRFHLEADAVGRMPEAACAAYSRKSSNGGTTSVETLVAALDEDAQREWYEIAVEAMEAEAHSMPVPRTVTEDEIGAIFSKLDALATPDELRATRVSDPAQSDAAWCAALRARDAVLLRLSAADLTTYARYSAQP